jgi:acyl carrier protein
MEINDFVKRIAEQFEEVDSSKLSALTSFRNIEGWSSFTALSIIAMVDETYNAKLTGDDIRKSKTILDIFNIINSKV